MQSMLTLAATTTLSLIQLAFKNQMLLTKKKNHVLWEPLYLLGVT